MKVSVTHCCFSRLPFCRLEFWVMWHFTAFKIGPSCNRTGCSISLPHRNELSFCRGHRIAWFQHIWHASYKYFFYASVICKIIQVLVSSRRPCVQTAACRMLHTTVTSVVHKIIILVRDIRLCLTATWLHLTLEFKNCSFCIKCWHVDSLHKYMKIAVMGKQTNKLLFVQVPK